MTTRPRRNRVTPTGVIVASPERGRAMGNRGPLIDATGEVVRDWLHKRWICCTLREVHGRRVRFDDPRGYTPLFFTDEAVALAAGHRPCGSCRPEAYYRWLAIWRRLSGHSKFERVKPHTMDRDLHVHRSNHVLLPTRLEDLAAGSFVKLSAISAQPMLIFEGRLWPWRDCAYAAPIIIDRSLKEATAQPLLFTEYLMEGYRFDEEMAPLPGY